MGSRLPGLPDRLEHSDDANPDSTVQTRYKTAAVEDVHSLPTRWFGYDAVDELILPTGNGPFLADLLKDRQGRKEALAEWVRRGGRLVLSAGHNHELAARLLRECFPEPTPLGLEIVGGRQTNRVQELERLHPGKRLPPFVEQPNPSGRVPVIELATIGRRSGYPVEVVMPRQGSDISQTLIARTPHGLGQVTLLGFDLDEGPMVRWGGQPDFWSSFLHLRTGTAGDNAAGDADSEQNVDLASRLQNHLEHFADVPVISFGWVALLILLYILIVGPLDYVLLRKLIGRLEFTWITFPIIVLSISALAYLAASALKGHELRINKVDLVDVDLQGGQTVGQTWFTLFSPH